MSARVLKPRLRCGAELADKVRSLAQEAWGDESGHADVLVMPDPPERVPGGYWVKARLWVPDEWVENA
jgi:hypothetical protein